MDGDRAGGDGAAGASAERRGRRYQTLLTIARWTLIAVGVLPWALPFLRAYLPLGALGEGLDWLFWPVCHRFPARTLELAGVRMPLCSRCAGIFAGLALGAAAAWPRLPLRMWPPVLLGAAALMVAEVITQDLGLHPVFHPTRIATGILLGYAMSAALSAAASRPRL